MRKWWRAPLFLVIAALRSVAQEQTAPPAPANGESQPLALASETPKTNRVTGTLGVGGVVDDNAYSNNVDRVTGLGYFVAPSVLVEHSTARLGWGLSYGFGLTANQRLGQSNLISHLLGFTGQYRLTPRFTVRFRDNFNRTTSPYDRLNQKSSLPGFGALQQANESVIVPLSERTDNMQAIDLNYQLGSSDVVTIRASRFTSRFENITRGAPARLIDSRSKAAEGSFSHRLARKHWIGAIFRAEDFRFQPGQNRTLAYSLLYFHTILLKSNMTLSLFAGPEDSRTHNQVVEFFFLGPFVFPFEVRVFHKSLSITGGSTYNWQGQHTAFQASYVHRISDGEGLLGAVRLDSVNGGLRRRLGARWTGELGGAFGNNRLLSASSSFAQIRGFSVSAGLNFYFAENLSLDMRYTRSHQNYGGNLLAKSTVADHDRAWVTLSYRFSRPWGSR